MNFLRVILSPLPYCNYRCILCHREGIPPSHGSNASKAYMSNSTLFDIYEAAKMRGHHGVVFTGGEPLLEPKLFRVLELFQSELTMITTNGSLLSSHMIRKLKAASLNQLNISICSIDPGVYARVTRQSEYDVKSVMASIAKAVAADIRVQVNTVLYKGINDDLGTLRSILEFARQNSVAKVVFIKATVPTWSRGRPSLWSPDYRKAKEAIASLCSDRGRAKRGDKFNYQQDVEVVLTACTDERIGYERVNSSDLCVDIRGYVIPILFSQRRIPVVPDQAGAAVELAIDLRNRMKGEL